MELLRKKIYILWEKREEIFGADLRSLAALRIGIALLIIADLILRARDLVAFYTDEGILPRISLLGRIENPWFISLHFLNGTWQFEAALFVFAGIVACFLLVGYRTRIATILSWFLLISLQARNLTRPSGSDVLLRLILFWGIFLPWGKRFSFDSLKEPKTGNPQYRILSIGTFAYLMQIVFVYWFAALAKANLPWIYEGSGLYYALNADQFVSSWGIFLRQFPLIITALSYAIVFFESIGPLLLLAPLKSGVIRTGVIFGFIAMHMGFGSFMSLGLFPWIGAIAMIGLFPSWFWEKLKKWGPYKDQKNPQMILEPSAVRSDRSATPFFIRAACIFFLGYVFLWNVNVFLQTKDIDIMPAGLKWIGYTLMLEQRWAMFGEPYINDGWIVIPGKLFNGATVDLLRNGGPITWEKPAVVSETFANYRWRKHLLSIIDNTLKRFRIYYARYLCNDWNGHYEGETRLASVEIVYMLERTLPNRTIAPPQKISKLNFMCPN